MKKLTIALAMIAGFATTSLYAAGGVAIPDGDAFKITGGDAGACKMLETDTVVNFSKGVKAGYLCDTGNNVLGIATCNPNGSRKETKVKCTSTDANNDGTLEWSPAGCSATVPEVTVKNQKGFKVYNTGGSVATVEVGNDCTGSNIASQL